MNVIFLTVSRLRGIRERGIYADLMRKFRDEGHQVYIVSPVERQFGLPTSVSEVDGVHILNVKTLNVQKTNIIEKGIGTVLLESQYKSAIKRYLGDIRFDLILYSTPPITLNGVIEYLKKKNPQAVSYLMLKDIFPQNAVDLGIFTKSSILYCYFRQKETRLYRNSDYIGCMSPANVAFVLNNNPEVISRKVELCPNAVDLSRVAKEKLTAEERTAIRMKYSLPTDEMIFVYGGNLGKPQGVPFLIACLEANADREDCHFLIVGNGTEYGKLEAWFQAGSPRNVSLFKALPKADYDLLVRSCDVGLIFLDYRFSIPNYPSRLLSYLENKMPVLAATDESTDIGRIAEENGYGYWCKSNDVKAFSICVERYLSQPDGIKVMGANGYQYLLENYQIEHSYNAIMRHLYQV